MASQQLVVVRPKQSLTVDLMARPYTQVHTEFEVEDMQFMPSTLGPRATAEQVQAFASQLQRSCPDHLKSYTFFNYLKRDGFLSWYYDLNMGGPTAIEIHFKFVQPDGTVSVLLQVPKDQFSVLLNPPQGRICFLTDESVHFAIGAVAKFIFRQDLNPLLNAIGELYAAEFNANKQMFEFVQPDAFFQATWDATVDALRDIFMVGDATSTQQITKLIGDNLKLQIVRLRSKYGGARMLHQGQEIISSFVRSQVDYIQEIKKLTVQGMIRDDTNRMLQDTVDEQAAQLEQVSSLFAATLSFQQQSPLTGFAAAAATSAPVGAAGAQMALHGPPAALPVQAPMPAVASGMVDISSCLPVQASDPDGTVAARNAVQKAYARLDVTDKFRFNSGTASYITKIRILGDKRTKLGHRANGETMALGIEALRYLQTNGYDVHTLRFIQQKPKKVIKMK